MRLATAISIALATISTASAQTERDLDSHDHGHAFLNIAVDGNTAVLELESPWNNLVGFEHAPSTDEQHAKVDAAMAMLNQPNELFMFNGAECVMTGAVVQSSLGEGSEHDDHDDEHDHDHKDGHDEHHDDEHDDDHKDSHDEHHDDEHDDDHKDSHDEHHDDEHKDGHDDDHDHDHDHDGEGEAHSSVLASYNFDCGNINDLKSIEVGLFEKMSGFEEIDVQLIGPGGQDAAELSADQHTVDIGKVL